MSVNQQTVHSTVLIATTRPDLDWQFSVIPRDPKKRRRRVFVYSDNKAQIQQGAVPLQKAAR